MGLGVRRVIVRFGNVSAYSWGFREWELSVAFECMRGEMEDGGRFAVSRSCVLVTLVCLGRGMGSGFGATVHCLCRRSSVFEERIQASDR